MILIDGLVPLKSVEMKGLAEIKQQVRNLAMLTNNNLYGIHHLHTRENPGESWKCPFQPGK